MARISTQARQQSSVHHHVDQRRGDFDFLKDEAELEKLDRRLGHQYIPMDIYVDSMTVKEHFQASSIRNRWARIHHPAS